MEDGQIWRWTESEGVFKCAHVKMCIIYVHGLLRIISVSRYGILDYVKHHYYLDMRILVSVIFMTTL